MHSEDDQFPWDPSARDVVISIRDSIVANLKSSLLGLYLHGSLVAGDFDREVSDIDLIAVLAHEPSDEMSAALKEAHDLLAQTHPGWEGRIEVVYVSAVGLRTYRDGIRRMAVISPGEPFHVVAAGPDWTLTWYPARADAVALAGPPISTFIPQIPEEEFLDTIRACLRKLPTAIKDDDTRGSCAYVVITVCRGMYTLAFRERPSKIKAATWAARKFPQWGGLIESALAWRSAQWARPVADPIAVAESRRFVRDMDQTERLGS